MASARATRYSDRRGALMGGGSRIVKDVLICAVLCCAACGSDTGLPQRGLTAEEERGSRPLAAAAPRAETASAPSPAETASTPPASTPSVEQASATPPAAEGPGTLPLAAPATDPGAAPGAVPAAPEPPATPSPAAESPVEAPSVEAPPVEAPPVEAPSVEAPPVEAPRAAEPPAVPPAVEVPSNGLTVTVSFTFDDTYQPQVDAAAILEAHGLRGTFYVNSPQLHRASANPAAASSMSISDVLELQSRGHDIGGHTLGHLSLTDLPEVERTREILGDRAQLLHLGIDARSFAYPYGHVEADSDRMLGRRVLEIARSSGYSSARDTNGVDLENCAAGPETLPPGDPFLLRSIRSVNEPPEGATRLDPPDTAATLLRWMDQTARCGGGWLPLIFHHLRADCSQPDAPAGYCFDLPELDLLAAQLAAGTRCPGRGERCYRVRVATVSAAIGSTELAPAPEVPGLRNPSLERTLDSGETECIRRTGASSRAVFRRSPVAHGGQASEQLAISAPYEAPAEIGIERDFGECSVFASEGGAYDLSLYYRAEPELSLPVLRFVTYRLTTAYVWRQWETSEAFAARSAGSWVRRGFTTAAVPAGTIALSFGLRQESAGVIEVDDFDAAPRGR